VLLLRVLLPWKGAIAVGTLKAIIPFAYFAWYSTGRWSVIDDVTYYREGRILLDAGYNPITVLLKSDGFNALLYMSDGYHFLYGWFNLFLEYLLGASYFAPVFGNVVLTCVCGILLYGLARQIGAQDDYARALAVFFVLQWEILAWSSFINVKDILVLTLTLGLLRSLIGLLRGFTIGRVAGVAVASFLLLWIRFYVPLIAGIAFALYRLIQSDRAAKVRGAVIALIFLFVIIVAGRYRIQEALLLIHPAPADILFGWIRTLLSPQPWSVNRDYGFLAVPSILHLATLPLTAYGTYHLVRRGGPVRLLFLYAALLLIPIAAFPELQGPRHRIQILFVLVWAQFHGAYAVARSVASRSAVARTAAP